MNAMMRLLRRTRLMVEINPAPGCAVWLIVLLLPVGWVVVEVTS